MSNKSPKAVDEFSVQNKTVCLWLWPDNTLEIELFSTLNLKTIKSIRGLPIDVMALRFEKLKERCCKLSI